MARRKPIAPSEPLASERTTWPPLSPGVDSSYPTLENLDAQQQWLAYIDSGRIKVR